MKPEPPARVPSLVSRVSRAGALPRATVAIAASLLLHVIAVGTLVGSSIWSGLRATPSVEIELVHAPTKPPEDLPLGPPPPPGGVKGGENRPRAGKPKPPASTAVAITGQGEATPDAGAADAGADDGGAPGDAGAPGTDAGRARRDLSSYGPEGSRLTAMVRLDRLRAGPDAALFMAATDELLRLLPDRRRLLDGSGLDLYRDFDSMLIATPNPVDDAVTFLAVRHHVPDDELRAALDRAAVAHGRPLTWRLERGRPIGERAARTNPDGTPRTERDDRLILLPAPGLAVVAPMAYAKLLLEGKPGRAGKKTDWSELVARLDAEEIAMPENAVLALVAGNLLGERGAAGSGDLPPPPSLATLHAGTAPDPFFELRGRFEQEEHARAWERRLPVLRAQALANPLVVLGGFAPLIARIEVARDVDEVTVRTTATRDEAQRILRLLATLTGARQR